MNVGKSKVVMTCLREERGGGERMDVRLNGEQLDEWIVSSIWDQ